ncbi:MAG TPA: PadR family transcriptional regulator [Gemmatimonadaceae bacterium]|jgi:transcriptional regulator
MPEPAEIVRGTLDLLILRAVSWGPVHGYSVARWIAQATSDTLNIEEGTLYPALHRLHERGLIAAEWGLSENNRRARYYTLTTNGRRHLRQQAASFTRYARAIFAALEAPAHPRPREA